MVLEALKPHLAQLEADQPVDGVRFEGGVLDAQPPDAPGRGLHAALTRRRNGGDGLEPGARPQTGLKQRGGRWAWILLPSRYLR